MRGILIPTILSATILVAASLTLMPVERVATTHLNGGTGDLADGSVTTPKLADGAVVTLKLADGSITSAKIVADSITTDKIADGTILTADVADSAIVTLKLADGSVTSAKILDGTIATGDIADGAIVTLKLADGSVTTAKIAADAVTSAQLADDSVGTAHIVDDSIANVDIAAHTSTKITINNKAQLNPQIVYDDQANTYGAGNKQTVQNSATTAGLNLASSADPSALAQGDMWLNTDTMKYRGSAATKTIANLDDAQTFTGTKTFNDLVMGGLMDLVGNTITNVGSWISNAADPADSGAIRLGNGEAACWEASPTGVDSCFRVDANENFLFDQNMGWTSGTAFSGIFDHANTADRTYTLPDVAGTLTIIDASQTLTNKVIRAGSNTMTADPSLAILTALGSTLPTTNPAAKTKVDGTNFSYFVLDFDQTTQETAFYTFEVPQDIDGAANIDARVRFISTTAAGGVCFSAAFRGVSDNEVFDGAFTSTQTVCDTTLNAAGNVNEITIPFTSAQHGLTGGDTVQFRLQRDPGNASDTMAADARVLETRLLWN